MSRDHNKLKVFQLADELVVEVYVRTKNFPVEERFGLQSQARRASVSVPTNIVEGCARRSTKDYLHFVNTALASASEVRYLLGLSCRLGMMKAADSEYLTRRYDELIRGLQRLSDALEEK
jgi:four helix bundle protein